MKELSDRTIETYLSAYSIFLSRTGSKKVSTELIQDFFFKHPVNKRNTLAILKILYPEETKDFKFQRQTFRLKILPSKEKLKIFYDALTPKYQCVFLLLSSSGLRIGELIGCKTDKENQMLIPQPHLGQTKHSFLSFYNKEAETIFKEFDFKIPITNVDSVNHAFKKVSKKTGIRIYPHLLRSIFAREMSKAGVPSHYIDAFCGRVPQSILARSYTDYSPETMKEIYDKANLRYFS